MYFGNGIDEKIKKVTENTSFSDLSNYEELELTDEPSVEDLDEIEKSEKHKKTASLKRGLDVKDFRYYVFRKKAYNGRRNPIISNESCTCPNCGKEYIVGDLYHQEDADDLSDDILYALLRLYDFSCKCTCGKYLYGYYKEPDPLPQWLSSALEEAFHPEQTKNKGEWVQLSFEDVYDTNELYAPTEHPIPETCTVEMTLDEADTDKELKEELSQVNISLDTFCTDNLNRFSDSTYFKDLQTCKTGMITSLAKRFNILNFARMNNSEKRVGIGLIQIMLDYLSDRFDESQKLSVAKILARNKASSSEAELKSLPFFSDEDVATFVANISPLKDLYDQLQTLTKKKMDLSKACIWGKTK